MEDKKILYIDQMLSDPYTGEYITHTYYDDGTVEISQIIKPLPIVITEVKV
jgi:hypothetical protein